MPSALERLAKILKLEQEQGCQNKAVIGGLETLATHWANEAHAQAKRPEHHQLVDELAAILTRYPSLPTNAERYAAIKQMLNRITGRANPTNGPSAPTPDSVPPAPTSAAVPTEPAAPAPESRPAQPASRPEPRSEVKPPPASPSAPRLPDRGRKAKPQQRHIDEFVEEAPELGALDLDSPAGSDDYAPVAPSIRKVEPPAPVRPVRRRRTINLPAILEGWRALRTPATEVSGVGPKIGEKLAAIGIRSLEDWLFTFPRRYDDYTKMLPLNRVRPGLTVTLIGTVRNVTVTRPRKGTEVLNVTIADGTGSLTASFFNQPYLIGRFEVGQQVVFSGKTGVYQSRLTMNNPEWEFIEQEALHTRGIVPVYPLTKGLSDHQMRKLSRRVVEQYAPNVPDYMPESVLERMDLADLSWALSQIHFPDSFEALQHARRRLAFDELILLQLAVLRNRRAWQSVTGIALPVSEAWLADLCDSFPFPLTGAQRRAIGEIRADMARPVPMNRLLQGDVGAGKTAVAAATMALALINGYQAALMAPTGILAEQHFEGLSRLLGRFPGGQDWTIRLLTGATPAAERAATLAGLADGSVQMVIGTHALIQDEVAFARLGVAVIDEQHRFGVEQRGKLRGKGFNPHVLVMTATPIPRTLALTLYADLDLSILDEMPPGRQPVQTFITRGAERERAYRFIEAQVSKGRQAFIVCPLVEASEDEDRAMVRSAVEEYERLQREVYPNLRLGLLHGKLSPAQKDAVMGAFSRAELDILVTTAVVEVGVDVPNANVIMVEGANRFGLAQLHQFRGRVGRGQHQSYCLLMPDDDDPDNARLKVMQETNDGFRLAEMDWQLRGAGELLGTRQSGQTAAKLAEMMDARLVAIAQVEARTLYEEDPMLSSPEHVPLRERVKALFGPEAETDLS